MSLNRHTMLILMLAGSVGLPYITSNDQGQQASRAMAEGQTAQSGAHNSDATAGSKLFSHPTAAANSADPYSYSSAYSSLTPYSGPSAADSPLSGKSAAPTPAQAVSTSTSAIAVGSSTATAGRTANSADPGRTSAGLAQAAGDNAAAGNGSADGAKRAADPPQALADVLHFDVTVPWIIEHWPRVSSGLSQLDLHGYRVPLITGTGESDLAGSLTYYFNKKQQLDRIIFHGTSGDPRPLVTYVGQHFELKRVIVPDPGLAFYQRKSWGKSQSELLIRPAKVLRADVPNKRYEIEMAIKRP